MTVKKLKAFDCNDLMLSHSGPGALLFVLASDYDALEAEWMSLSQEDGKVERALVRAEERIAELEADLAEETEAHDAWKKLCIEKEQRIAEIEKTGEDFFCRVAAGYPHVLAENQDVAQPFRICLGASTPETTVLLWRCPCGEQAIRTEKCPGCGHANYAKETKGQQSVPREWWFRVVEERDTYKIQRDAYENRVSWLQSLLREAHDELTDHGHEELTECDCKIARELNFSASDERTPTETVADADESRDFFDHQYNALCSCVTCQQARRNQAKSETAVKS